MLDVNIGILDVLDEFHWEYEPHGNGFKTYCPVCSQDKGKKRYTAIAFTDTDSLYCARCGRKFGWAKTHYALKHGGAELDESRVKEYARELYMRDSDKLFSVKHTVPLPERKKEILADVSTRNMVYRSMLTMLSLRKADRDDLLRRGMSEEDIERGLYRSVPTVAEKKKVLALLTECLDTLEGVPGFFVNHKGEWDFRFKSELGYLIPILNKDGQIELLLYRTNFKKAKYLYFSSTGERCGTGAKTLAHVSGDIEGCDEIVLTEGVLKSDVIQSLLNSMDPGKFSTVGVPGVSSLKTLSPILPYLKDKIVHVAYDMDSMENSNVSQAEEKLFSLLDERGIIFDRMYWNPQYKGLDDYLNEMKE